MFDGRPSRIASREGNAPTDLFAEPCTIRVHMTKLSVAAGILLVSLLVGCRSNHGLSVTTIQLGRTVHSDHTVGGITTTFGPDDTIYLAVLTGGAGSGTIRVRWTYGTRVIDEPSKQVAYSDAAATDFRLQSPSGFPTGDYTAEVFMNDQPVGTRPFKVEIRR
jgi:hypothetical protein